MSLSATTGFHRHRSRSASRLQPRMIRENGPDHGTGARPRRSVMDCRTLESFGQQVEACGALDSRRHNLGRPSPERLAVPCDDAKPVETSP
ncbi:hypothetical protein F8B43_3332 [Methylorubrum populi]|uniref:Uncharacterized protein n=1 Tax=Methylorubrum populi TaxID=223967 RepID=A0A833J6T7_9HYPH|nr:hypothetical protein F8B43_3332 [Methylorubrum populi]